MERLNLECDRSVAHATRRSEGSQGCREDTDNELNDGLPSFLFHDDSVLRVKHSSIFNFQSSTFRLSECHDACINGRA